jgi:DNA-binding NtrC family response regulator
VEKNSLRVLLVDDDKSLLDILGTIMELEGHAVVKAASAHAGLLKMREAEFDLVLVDLKMPRTTGIDMLRMIREEHPETKVVIMTAYATVNSTVEAMRLGVFDYLPKPFKLADLRTILDRAQRTRGPSPMTPASLNASPAARQPGVKEVVEKVSGEG